MRMTPVLSVQQLIHPFRRVVQAFAFLLLLFFLYSVTQSSFAQESKDKLQKNKKQLEEEIKYTNSLLEETKATKQNSMNKLNLLSKQIEKRESLITTVSAEADQLQTQIDVRNREIGNMSSDLQKMKDEYAKMIYYAYKNLNTYDRLLFIFSAKDFNQASNRMHYYQQYSSYRRTQAELIRSAQMDLTMKKRMMEVTRGQKLTLVQSKEAEKLRLLQEKEEKDKAVKELSQKEKQLRATLKQKQQTANQLQLEIQRLITSEIRSAAARAKKDEHKEIRTAKENKSGGESIMLTPVEKELSSSFASNRGRLPWPTERGVITSQFGEHPHPVLKYVKVKNNGIDISTSRGAGVRAVFGGKVSRVMSFPNLNKVVIIRHGDYLTVYSNLETVDVSDGQTVTTKQKIGTVHTNAEDARSEVHFELWLGKTLQDPQEWLARSSQ